MDMIDTSAPRKTFAYPALKMINRTHLFSRLSEDEIVANYRRCYGVGEEIGIDEIRKHAAVEGQLTDELLASPKYERPETFSRAYTELYAKLPWLKTAGTQSGAENWIKLMRPGSTVFEIGSGSGYIINALARAGFKCVGTDIASGRVEVARQKNGVTWENTDGVHLTQFTEAGAYDYVLSNQVVEHLHPDDIVTHFTEARKLLKPGGEYLMITPYAPLGPKDVSLVFGLKRPVFMHLREYYLNELIEIAKEAEFKEVMCVFTQSKLGICRPSRSFTIYSSLMDRLLRHWNFVAGPTGKTLAKALQIKGNIFLRLSN